MTYDEAIKLGKMEDLFLANYNAKFNEKITRGRKGITVSNLRKIAKNLKKSTCKELINEFNNWQNLKIKLS